MATLDDLLNAQRAGNTLQRKTQEGVDKLVALMKRFKPGGGSSSGTGAPKGKKGGGFEKFVKSLTGSARLAKGLAGLGRGLGYIGIAVGIAVAAFASVPLSMIALTKAVTPFVRALNPSSVQAFDRAQTNLAATIGSAFTPVIAYATQAVKEFSGILLPALKKLQPGIEKISRAFIGVAHNVGQIFKLSIERLAKFLEGAGHGLALLVEEFMNVAEVIAHFFNAFFAGTEFDEFGSALETAAGWLRTFTEGVSVGLMTILKALGFTDTAAAFTKSIRGSLADRENPKEGLTAAPTDVHTGLGSDLAKRLNERAFVATQADPTKKTDNQLLKEMAKSLAVLEMLSPDTISQKFEAVLTRWWNDIKSELGVNKPREVINDIGKTVKGGFNDAISAGHDARRRFNNFLHGVS